MRITRHSFLGLNDGSRFSCMIPHKLNQIDQGLRGKQHHMWLRSWARGWHTGNGEIRPVPGQGEQKAILTAEGYPRLLLVPEDPEDASLLPAGWTFLSQDG